MPLRSMTTLPFTIRKACDVQTYAYAAHHNRKSQIPQLRGTYWQNWQNFGVLRYHILQRVSFESGPLTVGECCKIRDYCIISDNGLEVFL